MRRKNQPSAPPELSYLAYAATLLKKTSPDLAQRVQALQTTWRTDGEALLQDLQGCPNPNIDFITKEVSQFITLMQTETRQLNLF